MRAGAVHLVHRPAAGFDPAGLLAAMSRNKVTTALVNPTFLRKMMQDVPDAGTRYPQSLRVVCCSNEPLTPDLIDWFREQFGVTLLDYYGSTESYPLLGNFPGVPVKPGSMGRPLPGWDVALLDEHDREVPVGQPGEICLRAGSNPQYPLGYWNRPEASAETFGGTWYRTRTRPSWTRTATSGSWAAPTTSSRPPGTGSAPTRWRPCCAGTPPSPTPEWSASPTRCAARPSRRGSS
ncbi:AMP-binding protein [Streptomyces albus]